MRFPLTRLAMAATLSCMTLGAALAQDAEPQKLDRVEVTGSSIKRTAAENALPLTIVTREDIARTGATSVQDLVNLLPSNFGGAVANNNVGATGGASQANLRSLGAKYTLVLLNGRRVANFAFGNSPVDLNSIPLAAVERVEVLRDGASALYGADAVAGVMNFILRRDYQGLEVQAAKYKSSQKGGDSTTASIAGGIGDYEKQGYNLVVTASVEKIDPVKALDRAFANSAVRPELGINNSSPRNGIPNLSFTDALGNKYTDINPLRATGCNSPEFALVLRADATTCGTDYVKFIDLVPEQFRANFNLRQIMKAGNDHQLVFELMHTRDRLQSFYSPAPYTSADVKYPTAGRFYPGSITIPKGAKVPAGYRFADGTVTAAETVLATDVVATPVGVIEGRWRTVAAGGRSDITETENDRILLGANGSFMGWDYDTAVVVSKNKGEIFFGPGQFSYTKLTPLVDSGEINIFGPQDAAGKAALDGALLTGRQQAATSKSTEFDFRASRELSRTADGAWALALGVSYRRELLSQVSEPVLETGDQVGGNGPVPSVASGRKVLGVFGETIYPLAKDLELNVSARYDNYKNDFGTSFNRFSPKLGVKFQPMRDLTLRGSVAQGFRAPTLYENLRPFTTGNNTSASWSDPIRCPGGIPITSVNPVGDLKDECDVQLDAATSGDRNLKPEKSRQFSLGAAFSPVRELTMAADYWNIQITDPVVQKSEIQVLSDPATYKDNFYRFDPADPAQTPIKGSTNPDFPLAYILLPQENTAKIFASGLDLSAAYRAKFDGIGQIGVLFDGTLYVTHGYQYTGVPKVSDLGKFKDFGSAPRWRHALTFQWGMGMFNASLTNNYTHSYEDYTDPLSIDPPAYPVVRTVKAYTTWDAQVNATPLKGFTVTLGVKNLMDTDPPASRNGLYFQVGYDPTYTNPVGRQIYLSGKYSF